MVVKTLLFITAVLLAQQLLQGQSFSTTTASTGVDIIELIGTGNSGELIKGSFYSGKEKSRVTLNSNGIHVKEKGMASTTGTATLPTLEVFSANQLYAITYSFDPLINNRLNEKETIRIESLSIFPVKEFKDGVLVSDKYSIGTTLQLAPNQAAGQYTSGNPYKITVNFN